MRRNQDFKMTDPQAKIAAVLADSTRFVPIDDVASAVGRFGRERGIVYRSLRALEDRGALRFSADGSAVKLTSLGRRVYRRRSAAA